MTMIKVKDLLRAFFLSVGYPSENGWISHLRARWEAGDLGAVSWGAAEEAGLRIFGQPAKWAQ
jgi:hypothetical protein